MGTDIFEVKDEKIKFRDKTTIQKVKIIVISIVIFCIVSGLLIVLLLAFLLMKDSRETAAKVLEAESSFYLEEYVDQMSYDEGTIAISNNDSGKVSESDGWEAYEYVVGEDIDPGLYTIEYLPLTDEDYATYVSIERKGLNPDQAVQLNKDFDENKQYAYNIDLNEGDIVETKQITSVAGATLLIPQATIKQFDEDDMQFGIYKAGDAIKPGTYLMNNYYLLHVCSDRTYYPSINCDSVVLEDEEFTITEGDTLYVSTDYTNLYTDK